jgi:hypothetical protein
MAATTENTEKFKRLLEETRNKPENPCLNG